MVSEYFKNNENKICHLERSHAHRFVPLKAVECLSFAGISLESRVQCKKFSAEIYFHLNLLFYINSVYWVRCPFKLSQPYMHHQVSSMLCDDLPESIEYLPYHLPYSFEFWTTKTQLNKIQINDLTVLIGESIKLAWKKHLKIRATRKKMGRMDTDIFSEAFERAFYLPDSNCFYLLIFRGTFGGTKIVVHSLKWFNR